MNTRIRLYGELQGKIWMPVTECTRDFHKEMFAVICGALSGHGPHSVKLVVNGHKFRCVPSVKGGVILYKDGGRNQYHHLDMAEWEQWATENYED